MLNETSIKEIQIVTNANAWSRWFRGLAKVLECNICLEGLEMVNEQQNKPTADDQAAFQIFRTALKRNKTLKKVKLTDYIEFSVPQKWIEDKTLTKFRIEKKIGTSSESS